MGRYQPEGTEVGLFSGLQYHERDFTMQAVHSVFFQILSETGTTGSLLFVAIVVGHFAGLSALRRRCKRDARASPRLRMETELYAVALGGAMMGYLASGAFLAVAYYPYPWYFSAFAVALSRAVDAQLSSRHAAGNPEAGSRRLLRPGSTPRFDENKTQSPVVRS
jgi:hypothetical protein